MKDLDGEPLAPAAFFALPAEGEDEPREIAARLVETCPEFADLKLGQPVIMFLLRGGPKMKGGKAVLAEMALPRFQGSLAPVGAWLLAKVCGDLPDYICTISADWWRQATPARRAALIHHELKHCFIVLDPEGEKRFDDDGNPQWGLAAHDLEEFSDTVRRYGDWAGDVAPFVRAAREGGVG